MYEGNESLPRDGAVEIPRYRKRRGKIARNRKDKRINRSFLVT